MIQHFDAIVVGAGVTGCAAARALAVSGKAVLILEASTIGHSKGSSHGRARIARLAYPDPGYVSLCKSAYSAWHMLEAEAGETLLQVTGGLDIGWGPSKSLKAIASALSESGVPFEFMDCAGLAMRFPQFSLDSQASGIFQRDAGILHADRCLAALLATALSRGARLNENETVNLIEPTELGVTVTTDSGIYYADKLILAAGPNMQKLGEALGLDLALAASKEQVGFAQPSDRDAFTPGKFPVFILHLGNNLLGSGFPLVGDEGIKLMIENKLESDPEDFSVDNTLAERLNETMRGFIPGIGEGATRFETCRYTLTPDEDFIVDLHPAHPQIVIASPCSGHGFKFAPLLGQAIADLASGLRPAIDITPFRIDRAAIKNPREGRHA